MQLKLATDHAIRTLLYLSTTNCTCATSEISEAMHISLNYLRSTILNLRSAGLVSTRGGQFGGCRLLKSPEEITLYDVISIMEGTIKIKPCWVRRKPPKATGKPTPRVKPPPMALLRRANCSPKPLPSPLALSS